MSRSTQITETKLIGIWLTFFVLFLGLFLVIVKQNDLQKKINGLTGINSEQISKIVNQNHEELLLRYSLQTMREEVDSLKEVCWNTNQAWLTVYDFVTTSQRYEWINDLDTDEIDSIMSNPEYDNWTNEECVERLKEQGVIK